MRWQKAISFVGTLVLLASLLPFDGAGAALDPDGFSPDVMSPGKSILSSVVDGTVTDAHTGWPLYARIDIDGYPDGPVWTNPVTGYYSVTLAENIPYTFHVSAWTLGYLEVSRVVGPLTGPRTEDVALGPDLVSCAAPGYGQSCFFSQNFEAGDGGFTASGLTSWEWGAPTSGPGIAHSGDKVWATNLSDGYTGQQRCLACGLGNV